MISHPSLTEFWNVATERQTTGKHRVNHPGTRWLHIARLHGEHRWTSMKNIEIIEEPHLDPGLWARVFRREGYLCCLASPEFHRQNTKILLNCELLDSVMPIQLNSSENCPWTLVLDLLLSYCSCRWRGYVWAQFFTSSWWPCANPANDSFFMFLMMFSHVFSVSAFSTVFYKSSWHLPCHELRNLHSESANCPTYWRTPSGLAHFPGQSRSCLKDLEDVCTDNPLQCRRNTHTPIHSQFRARHHGITIRIQNCRWLPNIADVHPTSLNIRDCERSPHDFHQQSPAWMWPGRRPASAVLMWRPVGPEYAWIHLDHYRIILFEAGAAVCRTCPCGIMWLRV